MFIYTDDESDGMGVGGGRLVRVWGGKGRAV